MTTDLVGAVNDINALFFAAWKAQAFAVVDYVPRIVWAGKEEIDIPDDGKFWCRHSTQNVLDRQSSFATCAGEIGKRRFTASGLVFVEIYAPKAETNSLMLARRLAQIAQNAYRGVTSVNGVLFQNVRVQDKPSTKPHYRLNVVAEYEYDELH